MNKEAKLKLVIEVDKAKSTTAVNNGIKSLESQLKSLKIDLDTANLVNKVKTADKTVSTFMTTNKELVKVTQDVSAGLSKFNVSVTSGEAAIKKYDNIQKKLAASAKEVSSATNKATSAVNSQEKAADKLSYSWKKAFTSFSMYLSVTTVFYTAVRAMSAMVEEVSNLDAALTELKKVTDLQGDSLDNFVSKAYEAGETVARTGTQMVEAATEFAKAGYDEDTILYLGKVATMYQNIADEEISAADSASFIIAQMKAFNIAAEDAYTIIDSVNEVSNEFAVSSSDIAENLGKSSSVMANAGNTLSESIALLTAGTEITQNASKISNGLKSITLNLQGLTDEGTKDLELQAKLENAFNKIGLSLMDSNGELKSTYDILSELAPVYEKMDVNTKSYYTNLIAG